MILQALVRLYEDLAAKGKIARPGWAPAKISFALAIGDDGALLRVLPLKTDHTSGKKTVLAPQILQVPLPEKRTVGVKANFLCDNASYFLGSDDKGKPQRTRDCFSAARELHLRLLDGINSPAAQAARAFFSNWKPEEAETHPALLESLEEIKAGANLIFWYGDGYVHEDEAVRAAWQAAYSSDGESPELPCLVTGHRGPVAVLHPTIKSVRGAQSSGASLVSFNSTALESYGHEMSRDCGQGFNAPVSEYAAFAYGAALNYLLADREHVQLVGDTTVVAWAEGGEIAYTGFGMAALLGASANSNVSDSDLMSMLSALALGKSVSYQGAFLDPNNCYYVLGLAPNAARLSVRFFLQNTFGGMMKYAEEHFQRLEIEKPAFDKFETLPLWKLLSETVNPKSTDKAASPQMSGEVLRSILTGERYPASLLSGVMLRIRAEHEVTRGRAAIIKAYYTKNEDSRCPKEVLTVSCNTDSCYPPYVLGRLFSVLEAIQQSANPGINATIRDKYFNSASATPATIFPLLLNLSRSHLRKLDAGLRVHYEKQLTDLMGRLAVAYPTRLALPDQGSFHLGYYHETQRRYTKKEEN